MSVLIDESNMRVEWHLDLALSAVPITTPWATLQVGAFTGAGLEVWVEAAQPFALALHTGAASFYEFVTPGRHRLLLPLLDRGDVQAG